jgi:hypothetical protein
MNSIQIVQLLVKESVLESHTNVWEWTCNASVIDVYLFRLLISSFDELQIVSKTVEYPMNELNYQKVIVITIKIKNW